MNVLVRGGAEISATLLGAIATVWISRNIGPTYFGYFAVMVAIITLGGLLINAGLSTAGAQRIANDPGTAGETLWTVTVCRALTALLAILGASIVLAVAPVDPVLRGYLRVGLVVWAVAPFQSGWALVARAQVRALSAIRIGGSIASVACAILLVRDASGAQFVAWVPVVTAITTAAGSSLVANRTSPFRRPAGAPLGDRVRAVFADGLHYLKSDASVFIYTSSDRLFLYVFATPTVVGLYEAAYRVIQPFYMISAVVGDAMYLPLARAFGTDRLRPTFRRFVDLMCFATIPLGFFLLAFAPTVIATLYGKQFAGASQYLAILGWVITFGYTSGVAVIPFSAWNRPREYGNSTLFGGALNLGLNFVLIPSYQGFGAAWATVAAKVAVTLAGVRYFRRATDYPLVRDFVEYASCSAAASAAAFAAAQLLPYPAISGITAFGLTYVGLVAVVRWRRYGPLTAATLGAIVPERPDVSRRGRP